MARNIDFHDYVVFDMMGDLPGISTRPMFSGWGIYKDRKIFGLIIDGELYFKVNDKNLADFKKRESHPFVYSRKGKEVTLSYWILPEEVLGDRDVLNEWINIAVG